MFDLANRMATCLLIAVENSNFFTGNTHSIWGRFKTDIQTFRYWQYRGYHKSLYRMLRERKRTRRCSGMLLNILASPCINNPLFFSGYVETVGRHRAGVVETQEVHWPWCTHRYHINRVKSFKIQNIFLNVVY